MLMNMKFTPLHRTNSNTHTQRTKKKKKEKKKRREIERNTHIHTLTTYSINHSTFIIVLKLTFK